ncbi:MAG TPA: nucleotidyltransferase family protein [Magnetospirillaceae bacterium]|jgi:molybdenum cofactor cytidylyltransferase
MPKERPPIIGLLLAAGRASRFRAATGRDKLAEPIPLGLPYAGIPVIAAALSALRPAVDEVIAVVSESNARAIGLVEALGATAIRCSSGGTGESIALGVNARPDAGGWVVALADMPFIRSETIRAIAKGLERADLVAPSYKGQRGHPVGFGKAHGATLATLTGDEGARAILKLVEPLIIETDDVGTVTDIDSPEDWKAARI